MILKTFIITIFLSIIFIGCTPKCDCDESPIFIAFIGYSQTDIDTFVIKKYKVGSNYQTLIDTSVVAYGDYVRRYNPSNIFHDTIYSPLGSVYAGFDWQIVVPSKNKTILISNIMSTKTTGPCGPGRCTNQNISAKIDNVIFGFSAPTITTQYNYCLFTHN